MLGALAVLATASALGALAAPAAGQSTYEILVSATADRANAVPLQGQTAVGDIYAFTAPDTDVKQVRFWLDNPARSGSPFKIEKNAPYDFNGTAKDDSPFAFDTTKIADGSHEITAELTLLDNSKQVIGATFTVDNDGSPSLVFDPDDLRITADEGDPPVTETVELAAADGSQPDVDVSGDADWLTVDPESGTAPASVSITADPGALGPGTHTATVTATALGYAAASLPVTVAVGVEDYTLMVSPLADRSSAVALDGSTQAGDIHAFTTPDTNVKQVRFWLDDPGRSGSPFKLEKNGPYDLNGTASDGSAIPFDTTTIADGSHQVTAELTLQDNSKQVVGATFTVDNGGSASLAFSPTPLRLSAEEGGDPVTQTVELTAGDGSDPEFAITDDAGWLSVSPETGSTPATLTVTADPAGLARGTHSATITAGAPGYASANLPVTLAVGEDEYTLLVSASSNRSNPVALRDTTQSGNIHVFTSPDTDIKQVSFWLDSPTMSGAPFKTEKNGPFDFNGSASDGSAIPFNTETIPDGLHEITARLTKVDGSTVVVSDPFTVGNHEPALVFDPPEVNFATAPGGSPATQTVELSTTEGGSAGFNVSDNAPWLSVTPTSGTTPATLTLTANPAGLAEGPHTATVTASAGGYPDATLTVTLRVGGCGTISPLACSQVLVGFPYELDFSTDFGKLDDGAGVGTGFTMVDPPSNGDGYLPGRLSVNTAAPGTLNITTTKGLATGSVNSQDNALGIGIDAPDHVSLLSTTIVDPPAGTGKHEQGGLWFGNDEDNHAKLVVRSAPSGTDIQYVIEVNGSHKDVRTTSTLDLAGKTVELTLRADPTIEKVAASYVIDGGERVQIASFKVPGEFFSRDQARIDPTIGTDTFGGIFASHRNGSSPLVYRFTNFSLIDDSPPSTVSNLPFTRSSFPITRPTSMTFGPDGRLYVSELLGRIHALTLDENKQVVDDDVITTLGTRLTLGITIDPASTPSNVILWATHSNSDLSNNAPANSSAVSRLSGPGFTNRQDVITGLPRSKANHTINSLHFGPDGKLYIAQGGNTGAGANNAADSEFGDRPEQPLSAAILVADVKAPGFEGQCATPIGSFGIPSTCDVQTYATGLRNAYDFVWHSSGDMFATENGTGVTSTFPPTTSPPCTALGDTRPWQEGGDNPGDQPDLLLKVQQGKYYGHPNPYRNECVFKDGSFQGVDPLPNWEPPFLVLGARKSSNGIIEASDKSFGGMLAGDLLIGNFQQGDDITRVDLDVDGTVVKTESMAGGFSDPLPLVEGPDGTFYVGEFGANKVTVLVPGDLGSWTTRAPLPNTLLDAGGAALNGKVYVVGGKTGAGPQRAVHVYDPATDSWTRAPDLPSAYPAVENPSVAALNGKLYVFGGSTEPFSGATTAAAAFDPATNTWTMLAPMPTARGGAAAQALGGRIYVVGGMDSGGGSVGTVTSYDPASNTWTTRAPMGTRRDNPGAAALGGKLYVFGGRTRNADGATINGTLNTVEAYDPAANAWAPRAPMPTGRRTMVVGTIGGRAQVLGGEQSQTATGTFEQNEEYDPLTDTWRTLAPMPTPRHGAAAGTVNGVVYVVSGGPQDGPTFSNVNEAFTIGG